MTCVNCARTIEIALKRKEGVRDVEVSFELGRVKVDFDENKVSEEDIARTIEELGYRVLEEEGGKAESYLLLFSGLSALLITALMFYPVPYGLYVQFLLSTLVQVFGGWKFYKGAYNSLRNGVAGMDVLVSLGTTGAYVYSLLTLLGFIPGSPFFETNTFLITFVRGGRFIEERAKKRALRLLKSMLTAQHSEVSVLEDGNEVRKNVRELMRGEVIVCRPGDLIPIDGVVVKGRGYVSEAVLTGEPEPILKEPGDRVISGSILEDGLLEIRVEASYESSYLSKINRMVESALSEKPRIQRIADTVSHYFVQAVVVVSAATFFLWVKLTGSMEMAVQFSLAVLVISCPCAMGIATPLAVVVGISKALSRGILIKKPSSLEVFPLINAIVFDKTGTLTEGRFQVVRYELRSSEALDIAYSMESFSNHPIAKAIRDFAKKNGARKVELVGCREVLGRGVECGEYFIGEYEDENIPEDVWKAVALRRNGEVLAVFYLKDTLRQEAKFVVSEMKKLGLTTILLSGDRTETTKFVAKELGFDSFFAEVKPEEKKEMIKGLQEEGLRVAMVGDGVNDAPALAQSDLSFAVPHGVDITKQVGDVVLLSGVAKLPESFRLGKKVNSKIKQNLVWAFLYNVVGIPVAAGLFYKYGVYLKPELAGLLMALSSVSVVANTILLQAGSGRD
ncbi:cation transporting ATPase (E1-E2 family) protein [Hydrogenivirga sp. 128-5-R1-1]|nr:cation transporting ATPase (E1-E2 family) protein [Hydrogenivirga sp. 128-5-R1-1]